MKEYKRLWNVLNWMMQNFELVYYKREKGIKKIKKWHEGTVIIKKYSSQLKKKLYFFLKDFLSKEKRIFNKL